MAGFTISSGVHIFAARQNEAGNGVEYRRRGALVRKRRNYDWYEACIFKGRNVSGGQPDTTGIPILADTGGYSNCASLFRPARGRHQ